MGKETSPDSRYIQINDDSIHFRKFHLRQLRGPMDAYIVGSLTLQCDDRGFEACFNANGLLLAMRRASYNQEEADRH